MQVVIRTYSGPGAKDLFDLLEKRQSEVENLIRSVKGFVSYTIARTGDGGFTVTICNDKAGIDESVQRAKEWVAKNAGNIGSSGTPKVTEGSVIVHAK